MSIAAKKDDGNPPPFWPPELSLLTRVRMENDRRLKEQPTTVPAPDHIEVEW